MIHGWTDARMDTLRTLWADGLSCSQIAEQLGGVTRNAVIGKVHRLGLPGRMAPDRKVKRAQPSRRRKAPYIPGQAPRMVIAGRAAPQRVEIDPSCFCTLEGLTAQRCKFPYGDPQRQGFGYCGRVTDVTASYCADHEAVAYTVRPPRKSKAPHERSKADQFRDSARWAAL